MNIITVYSISTVSSDDENDFEHDLDDALTRGAYVELSIAKILTTGAATAGKTCTKHYIFDMPPPPQYKMTAKSRAKMIITEM